MGWRTALLQDVRLPALGAKDAKFYVGSIIGHSSLHPSPELSSYGVEPIEVEVIPLDDVVPAGERVDVVKIDVEGAELAVLQGMTRIINENRDVVIIAEFGSSHLKAAGITPTQWFAAYNKYGFEAFAIDELTSQCRSVRPADVETIEFNQYFVCSASLVSFGSDIRMKIAWITPFNRRSAIGRVSAAVTTAIMGQGPSGDDHQERIASARSEPYSSYSATCPLVA